MSNLSKLTITNINENKLQLKIERIHPDAPSLDYLNSQNEKNIKASLLFRVLNLLETLQSDSSTIYNLYKKVFSFLLPIIEEEEGEIITLDKYTELTEYGSDFLIDIVDEIISSATLIKSDINKNWENGLIKNFNPYKSENQGVPYVVFEIDFKETILEPELMGKVDFSAMGITCRYK